MHEHVDPEWEKRKYEPSTLTFKDQYTPGHVRLVRVRDADTMLKALADSRADADAAAAEKNSPSKGPTG